MKRYRYILTLFLVLIIKTGFSHSDFWVIENFGNIKVRIKTGFKYEEINKVFLIGQLAEQFAKQLNYSEQILLDFHHYYVGNCEPDYFISYDKGGIQYTWHNAEKKKDFLEDKSIIVRQVARQFDAQATIKLLEYAILNIKDIKSSQKKIKYNKNYCQWEINSIDTNLIKKIFNSPNSIEISSALNMKFEKTDHKYGISYYLHDNKYTIFVREYYKKDTALITLDNIYDLKKITDFSMLVFDTDSSFYFIQKYKQNVSNRHIIQETNNYYEPFKVEYIGGGKISIYFWYYPKENPYPNQFLTKERTLIYLTEKDELIQDLDKLINEK